MIVATQLNSAHFHGFISHFILLCEISGYVVVDTRHRGKIVQIGYKCSTFMFSATYIVQGPDHGVAMDTIQHRNRCISCQ